MTIKQILGQTKCKLKYIESDIVRTEGFLIIKCLVNLLLVAGVLTVKKGVSVSSFSGQEQFTIYLSICPFCWQGW